MHYYGKQSEPTGVKGAQTVSLSGGGVALKKLSLEGRGLCSIKRTALTGTDHRINF